MEALILVTTGEFTPEDDRILRETCAQALQLGDDHFDKQFPGGFAGEMSIPQVTLDALSEKWKEARSKDPGLTPREFAVEYARLLLEVYP